MVPHLHTREGITVVLFNRPYHAAKDDPIYEDVLLAIANDRTETEMRDIFERAAVKLKAATKLTPNLEYSGGVVLYKGEPLANYATDKLIELLEANLKATPLINFLENLMQNPSKRVVDDLYRFLEKGRMPITEDGHFLAYKKVRADYKDIHSGKFSNTIGATFEMPRNMVDEDAQRTCSVGFHVCSYDYLPNFASSGNDRVMVCKINPAHVVAIPADYNDTKMRVYKYVVTDEVTNYFKAGDNVLTKQSVSAEKRDFRVLFRDRFDDVSDEHGEFWTKEEAIREAQELTADWDVVEVEQISTGTGVWSN
jgi:hypothetical protein